MIIRLFNIFITLILLQNCFVGCWMCKLDFIDFIHFNLFSHKNYNIINFKFFRGDKATLGYTHEFKGLLKKNYCKIIFV